MTIILIIILLIIIWLIVAPIVISIDSEEKELLFEYAWIVRFRAVLVNYMPVLTIELPFKKFRLSIDGGKAKAKKSAKKEKKKRKKRRGLTAAQIYSLGKAGIVFVKKTMETVRLKRAEFYLDTGNYPLNAMLIPVFCAIERKNVFAEINFVGYNKVFIKIQLRAVYILWQGIILASKLFYIIFFRRK